VNSSLEAALGLVIRDLQSTGGISLNVLDEPTDDDPRYESMWLLSDSGSRTGLLGPLDMTEPERVAHVADQVQDFVHEELGCMGRPATWPECPEHPASHPLTPTLISSSACWQCPKSGDTLGAIGEL
jgi:hypothetical protein